ncbi:alpha/beta hydrolase [Phenylobacterium sp.]|uniref:alpha/beta fold hydrolase n=1 Tax=Phenylobacterium sp. TaxID=1871053 RepID=UPI002B962A20|nr:alpha/beta hydrolase [Phenylobacterium sp.]HLZ76672.1 alpha/beta hydrolase [Phenylobacterium sp.]
MAATVWGAAWAAGPPDFGVNDFMAHKEAFGFHGGQSATLNGAAIYYETYGAGPPVLVLHGGTAFIETMHYQIEALAKDRLVIAPDSRGHGRSGDGPGPLHYHQMGEDMVALMDRLHVARADVVGWSDGGVIGLDLAIHHPDRVRRLVLMGANYDVAGLSGDGAQPAADAPAVAIQRDMYRRLSPTPDQWPVFYGKVVQMWRTEPHDTPAELARIRAPVLVIAGEHDAIRREHTDALAKTIPNAKEVIIPAATHFAPLTHPQAVDAAILAFLN